MPDQQPPIYDPNDALSVELYNARKRIVELEDALGWLVRLHRIGRPVNPDWDHAWTAARRALEA